jgi:hypothetical protein
MSYAGPVSRGKRAPDMSPESPAPARRPRAASPPPARRSASATADHRPTAAFTAGILLGVIVGAGAALLLAPRTGVATRRALARRRQRLASRGHDAWDDLRLEFRRALKQRRAAAHKQMVIDDDAQVIVVE